MTRLTTDTAIEVLVTDVTTDPPTVVLQLDPDALRMMARHGRRHARLVLPGLPPTSRLVPPAGHEGWWSTDELAAWLGITPSALRKRVSRGQYDEGEDYIDEIRPQHGPRRWWRPREPADAAEGD